MNLKKRVPEPMQEMEGYKEVKSFFITPQKLHRESFDIYVLIAKDLLKSFNIKKGKVLDVGCGYGGLIKQLAFFRKNLAFVGIDISKSMLKLGREYLRKVKAKLLFMFAEKLSFKNEEFDLVLCKDTFHHFQNAVKVLKEMYRVTKKGGHIYITDLRRDSSKKVVYQTIQRCAELNEVNAQQYIDSLRASYTISEMRKLLKKIGIENYKILKPKVRKNFTKDYGVNSKQYLSAATYLLGRWNLLIKK